jgi:hypothetical protein
MLTNAVKVVIIVLRIAQTQMEAMVALVALDIA